MAFESLYTFEQAFFNFSKQYGQHGKDLSSELMQIHGIKSGDGVS